MDTLLTTHTPGGYGLTTKEKRSSGHVTWLRVGEPCDPTTVYYFILINHITSLYLNTRLLRWLIILISIFQKLKMTRR
jgi:hypothetical protein